MAQMQGPQQDGGKLGPSHIAMWEPIRKREGQQQITLYDRGKL